MIRLLLLAIAAFSAARAPYQFVFPRDHAAHPAYRTEWWYYTGHLYAADGRRFGYELTFFRVGLRAGDPPPKAGESRWRGTQVFPAHFAITDGSGARFVHAERSVREALGDGAASRTALDVHAGDWSLRGVPGKDSQFERMVLHAAAGSEAIDLVQIPQKRPAIHGSGGVSRKGPCDSCASHYYSYTRLQTAGTMTYGGRRFAVTGLSWMDHEFGSSELTADQVGWDWFALQLSDGRELMLYRLRQKDGTITPQSSGSVIERDGSVRPIALRDFSIQATATWASPHTGARYPAQWRVDVPLAHLRLLLKPVLADQELANPSSISYWEGAVDVLDAAHPEKTLGVGYVELTGYAGTVVI